ncbi:MAG: hypothetical protein ACPG1A_15340, partial [Halioglobus sp.]
SECACQRERQGQTLSGGVVTDAQSLEHIHIAAGRVTNIRKYRHSKAAPWAGDLKTPTGFRAVIDRFNAEAARRKA